MSAHLGKIVLMVVMSHGFRTLGRVSGPRWAGLALGLPCSTAVALVGGGAERGIDYAVVMSGTSLIGLAGAVALPMAYSRAVVGGWRLPWAIGLGVASYLLVALIVGRLLPGGGDASLGVALMAVIMAVILAGRMRLDEDDGRPQRRPLSATWKRVFRAVVPIGCLAGSLSLGEVFGPEVAGLMSTFPGVTLTVLCLTHLESGPSSAIRMARALPAGNLGMVSFLAVFRFGGPSFGLAWGTFAGYIAALTTLALVVSFEPVRDLTLAGLRKIQASARQRFDRAVRAQSPAWPRSCRRFSPLVETFAS